MTAKPFTMPGSDLDLADPDVVVDLLRGTAERNRLHPNRNASRITLPNTGRLLVTGDLHDHTDHLRRVVKRARLDRSPDHHLVLHELIHGPSRVNGRDLSIRTLALACAVQQAYPRQVHFMLSNHELAQRRQDHVFKSGGSDVEAFNDGLVMLYGEDAASDVHAAFDEYVDSLALAVVCDNGAMISHSLPGPRQLAEFDASVLDRSPTEADYASDGSAHHLVWGRHQNEKVEEALSAAWGVGVFVVGHQPPDMGWMHRGQRMLIITSEHGHGVCLPMDLARPADREELTELILPINAIRL